MSRWFKIDDSCVDIDDDDIEILVNSDNDGNNYVIISLTHVMELVSEIEIKKASEDKE